MAVSFIERRLVTVEDTEGLAKYIDVFVPVPDSVQTLAADASTYWTSSFKTPIQPAAGKARLVKIGLQASWTTSAPDAVIEMGVKIDTGTTITDIDILSGNSVTDGYGEIDYTQTDPVMINLYASVKTPSTTSGATTNIEYALIVLRYEIA